MKKLFLLVVVASFLIGCDKDSDIPQHTISSIDPLNGEGGITVTINGSGFSEVIGENIVTFNNKQAVVSLASATKLEAIVPAVAGTGAVSVTIDGGKVTGPVFTYEYTFTVSTLAGTYNEFGIVDGTGSNAKFYDPDEIVIDENGNLIVADSRALRKVSPGGVVTTIAGSASQGDADGVGAAAAFSGMEGVEILADGSYVVSQKNMADKIKRVSLAGAAASWIGGSTGYVDGNFNVALFNNPHGMAIDGNENIILADAGNNVIRKITPEGTVSTIAGSGSSGFNDGTGTNAEFHEPITLVMLQDGRIAVVDQRNHSIRMISTTGEVSTLAGNGSQGNTDGTGAAASFDYPTDICVGHDGAYYVTDGDNYSIRRISSMGVTSTFAGGTEGYVDGTLVNARFGVMTSIAYDPVNYVYYISDYDNTLIRKIQVH